MANPELKFKLVRELYKEFRLDDRERLIAFLDDNGYVVLNRTGGKGKRNYTGSGCKGYDLSNWLWINASKDGKYFHISLQCFDKDKNSQNRHILMDRVGVCVYDKSPENFANAMDDMQNTDVDLPLNEEKMQKIKKFIESMK